MKESQNYRYRDSRKSDNIGEKPKVDTKNNTKKIKSNNFTGSNREKSNVVIAKLANLLFPPNIN